MVIWHNILYGTETVAVTFFIYAVTGKLLEIKRNAAVRALLSIVCMVLGQMIIYLADFDNLPPTMAVFLTAVWIFCRGSGMKRMTLGFLIASTVFAYDALIDNYLAESTVEKCLFRIIFGLVFYLGVKKIAPEKDFELSNTLWGLLLLLAAAPMGIVLCTVLLTQNFEPENSTQMLVLLWLSLLSFAGLLGTVAVMVRQRELEEAQLLGELNNRYYKLMEEQNFEVRRLKHDLINHLHTISSLDPKEKDGYIEELLNNSVLHTTMQFCGDHTVNAVLCAKKMIMEQKQIRFEIKADLPEPLKLEKPDICAILGNSLDNAIEAVSVFDEKKRHIQLELCSAKGLFVMKLVNPCFPQSPRPSGLIRTTKQDQENHGYGLKSIRKSAEKYGGTLELQQKEGNFTLFLYIPLNLR